MAVRFCFSATTISTHSPRVGRTRCGRLRPAVRGRFQLTRPVWGEPQAQLDDLVAKVISTHSPRVGRTLSDRFLSCFWNISTHSPRVGRTMNKIIIIGNVTNFNSLAPCGANQGRLGQTSTYQAISTHSPRVGRTAVSHMCLTAHRKFQLTRPVWGEPHNEEIEK